MGNYLPNPNLQRKTERMQKGSMDIVVSSMQGWRADMEDAHLSILDLLPGVHLFGIFDGHGGPEVAWYVSEYLPQLLRENQEFQQGNFKRGIVQCYKQLDETMLKDDCLVLKPYQRFPSEKSSAGCTAVLLILNQENYLIANLGDSWIVSFHKDQKVIKYDTEHKPDFPQESERIVAAGGKVIKGRINRRLNLSRALGDFNFKKNPTLPFNKQMVSCIPSFFEGKLDNTFEFFLLGCDGIWETKSDEKICSFLMKDINNPVWQCESLLEYVVSKNIESKKGKDNMSLILVRFKF